MPRRYALYGTNVWQNSLLSDAKWMTAVQRRAATASYDQTPEEPSPCSTDAMGDLAPLHPEHPHLQARRAFVPTCQGLTSAWFQLLGARSQKHQSQRSSLSRGADHDGVASRYHQK